MSQQLSGDEIIALAEGIRKGAELRLEDMDFAMGRTWWNRETETLHKLQCGQIVEGIRNKGLQEVNFSIAPSRYGENPLRSTDNKVSILRQLKEKQLRHEITGRELLKRIDAETGFLESCIANEGQVDTLKRAQEEYNQLVKSKPPEKDIAAVVKDRISEFQKSRTKLQGLENNTFTLQRNDIYSTIRDPEFIKKVEKLHELQLTGSELTKRIDGELEYFREAINSPEKRERLRVTQSVYKTPPEKDVVTIIEEKITDLELARLNLQGLEKASLTINNRENIHSIVKSPDFSKQIKRENGRFCSRDR